MENSKYDSCLEKLSIELMKTPIGDKVVTITDFCDDSDFARGTVQAAYMTIRDSNSICVNPRGRLGTFVQKKNYQRLLKYANVHFINLSVPLPFNVDYIGLNMGLKQNLKEELAIPILFTQTRSSLARLEDVMTKKVHAAVVSKYIALQAIIHNYPIQIVSEFGSEDNSKTLNPEGYQKTVDAMESVLNSGVIDEESRKVHSQNFDTNAGSINDMILDMDLEDLKRHFKLEYIDASNPQHRELVLITYTGLEHITQIMKETIDLDLVKDVKKSVILGENSHISY